MRTINKLSLALGMFLAAFCVTIGAQTASQGGSFLPTQDYTVTGRWTMSGGVAISGTSTIASGMTITSPTITGATLTTTTLTSPTIAGYTMTGTGTIGNGLTVTTPILSGSVTGTYTLAGTPTITAPTITSPIITTAYTISGTGTIANGATITTPVFPTGGVGFTNATSGTITIAPPTGALGTPTFTLPTFTSGGGVPVALDCGSTGSGNQTCSPTSVTGLTKIIAGHSTLASNAAVITLPASSAFTSTATYDCVGNDITTRANPVQVVQTSASTFTITNTTGASDVIEWICVGN